MDDFTIHGCEQVLRFSQSNSWNELSEELKVQIGFNMGVVALGLNLTKEEGYLNLVALREGKISMQEFNKKMQAIVTSKNIPVNEVNISKPF